MMAGKFSVYDQIDRDQGAVRFDTDDARAGRRPASRKAPFRLEVSLATAGRAWGYSRARLCADGRQRSRNK
jgi:hypothetical protein